LIDPRHSVVTTSFCGRSGLNNGALLTAAEQDRFELLITSDQELAYQQNLTARRIAVLVLSTNNWSVVKNRMSDISAAIETVSQGGFMFVDIGQGRG